ncbi:restriction endonuclease subunit S [Microbacterium paludicola]|uniref:restriction endonuclease subunit S n=1 Tax=Microbacterium paludicola TaxID=300019 RepID=UPI0038790744
MHRLTQLAKLVNGVPFDSTYFSGSGDLPLVRIRDLNSNDFETFISRDLVPDAAVIRDGDVVIGMDGDFNAVLWSRGPAALNQRLCLLRATSGADPRFIAYAIPDALQRVNDLTWSTTVKHLSSAQVRAIRVPAYTPDQQRAIADFLDRETAQIDAFIAENEKLIALLTERRAAAIARELDAAEDSEDVALRVLLRAIEQGESPQAEAGLAEADGSVGVLKAGCVNGGIYRATEHKVLPPGYDVKERLLVTPGDLVVNRASGSVNLLGSAALVTPSPYRLMLSDKTFRLVPNSLATRDYLYWVLNSARYRRQVARSVSGADGLANNLPMSVLRAIRVPLVPPARQHEVVQRLSALSAKVDEALTLAREAISLARERRAAIISSAVTGRLNLTEGV